MIEMSHTEEDLNEGGLFTSDEKQLAATDVSRKCNTALEILQNEVINCEKSISLEKSQRELNEKKLELDEKSKKVPSQVTTVYASSNECADHVKNTYSPIFSNDQFSDLVENIMRVGNHFNGIEEDDVQKIIFEFAELNEINHGFDKTLRKTENEWYQRFIQSHPNLNSVIKKSLDNSVQLHKTDIEFSSRIVDKFVSDYKSSKRTATRLEQNLKIEKYTMDSSSSTEQTFEPSKSRHEGEEIWSKYNEVSVSSRIINDFTAVNRNESDNSLSEKSDANAKVVYTESTAAHTDSKQPYFNSLKESISSCCLADSPEEVRDAVSSLRSINSRLGDDSAKRYHSGIDGNISKVQVCDSFGNFDMKEGDNGKVIGVNSNNHVVYLSQPTTCDSNETSLEKSFVASISSEGSETETKKSEDDCNGSAFKCENTEPSDVIFSRNSKNASNLETVDLESKTTENLEKLASAEKDLSMNDDPDLDKNDSNNLTEFPLDSETMTGEKNNDEIHLKTTCSNVPSSSDMSTSKRKEPDFSTESAEVGDEKNSKIVKRKRPLNKKTTKKSKNFMKPVIKLTKMDEDSFKNFETDTTLEQEANDSDQMETDSDTGKNEQDEVEADTNSNSGSVEKHEDEAESNKDINNDSKDETEAEMNYNDTNNSNGEMEAETNNNASKDSKNEIKTEANDNATNDLIDDVEAVENDSATNNSKSKVMADTKYNVSNDSTDHDKAETNYSVCNDSKDQVETETNYYAGGVSKNKVEAEANTHDRDDISKDEVEMKTNFYPRDDSEHEIDKINSDASKDSKGQVTEVLKTTEEKKLNSLSNEKSDIPTSKTNSTNASATPIFSMQTRRKRLKFLPDGTLVTPNQRHSHFLEDLSSTSRSESKTAKKRSLKTPPQDTPRPEKKIKLSSASNTPKQTNRPVVSTKKTPKSRPDRYIPESNGKSKKPQKIFDYDSYYRENFRETEVKLPPSCKKQMVALSRVTSISPAAQSGGQVTVNPAQLLSCLLGMPITPDQISTVRFKPPIKQLKPNKQIDLTSSKVGSSDAIKPITKRHLEMLQKTPFNIVPKTEIGVAKSNGGTKSKPVT